MERMTLKSYAVKHKLSLFNVVKMVKSGQLKSKTVEENGKEVTYILPEEHSSTDTSKKPENNPAITLSQDEMQNLVLSLQEEVTRLRREMDNLKISMGLK